MARKSGLSAAAKRHFREAARLSREESDEEVAEFLASLPEEPLDPDEEPFTEALFIAKPKAAKKRK